MLRLAEVQIELADVLIAQCDRPAGLEAVDLLEQALAIRAAVFPGDAVDVYGVKNRIISARTSLGLTIRPDLYA